MQINCWIDETTPTTLNMTNLHGLEADQLVVVGQLPLVLEPEAQSVCVAIQVQIAVPSMGTQMVKHRKHELECEKAEDKMGDVVG